MTTLHLIITGRVQDVGFRESMRLIANALGVGFELDLNVALTISAILLTISFSVLLIVKRALGNG